MAFGWRIADALGAFMNDGHSVQVRASLQPTFAGRGAGSLLEIDAWIHSEIKAISPLVERLMRLIEGSHSVTGEEYAVQLALREALNNAVVHGNRLDAHKLVRVRCRCKTGQGISLVVSDQGQGFNPLAVPNVVTVENLEADHGRGIHLMKLAMDEVSFEHGGTEVHMCKKSAANGGNDDHVSDGRNIGDSGLSVFQQPRRFHGH